MTGNIASPPRQVSNIFFPYILGRYAEGLEDLPRMTLILSQKITSAPVTRKLTVQSKKKFKKVLWFFYFYYCFFVLIFFLFLFSLHASLNSHYDEALELQEKEAQPD